MLCMAIDHRHHDTLAHITKDNHLGIAQATCCPNICAVRSVMVKMEDRPRSYRHVPLQHVILERHVILARAVNKGTEQRRRRRARIIVISAKAIASATVHLE